MSSISDRTANFEPDALVGSPIRFEFERPIFSRVVENTETDITFITVKFDMVTTTLAYQVIIPRLEDGSPALDRGIDPATLGVERIDSDLYGNTRPGADGLFDIGHHEAPDEYEPILVPTPTPPPILNTSEDIDEDSKPNRCESWQKNVILDPENFITNAFIPDSDGDGLLHGWETPGGCVATTETMAVSNPKAFDTDGDGIGDGVEILILGTDPVDASEPETITDSDNDGPPASADQNDLNPDRDGDGFKDGYEALTGSDPDDPEDKPLLGDVSGGGTTDNLETLTEIRNADVMSDGLITNLDAIILFNWILGNLEHIPLRPSED